MFPKGSGFLITNKYHIFSLLTLLSYFYSQTRDAKTSFAKRLNDIKLLERSIVTLCLLVSIYPSIQFLVPCSLLAMCCMKRLRTATKDLNNAQKKSWEPFSNFHIVGVFSLGLLKE